MDTLEGCLQFIEYLQLSEEECRLLQSAREPISSKIPAITERFYNSIIRDPTTSSIIANQKVVERLTATLSIWMSSLFCGKYDEEYFQRQLKIGMVHLRVGLSNTYLLISANGMKNDLYRELHKLYPGQKGFMLQRALSKVIDLSLAIISESYLDEQEKSLLLVQQQMILSKLPLMVLTLDRKRNIIASTVTFQRSFSIEKGHYLNAFPETFTLACPLPNILDIVERTGTTRRLTFLFNSQHIRLTVTNTKHQQLRFILLFEDITEIILLERKNSQIEYLAQIGRMAANLAHEIRNPIAGISSSLQILGNTFQDDQIYGDIIFQIQEKLQGMNNLVADLLLYSRPLQYNLQKFNIVELLETLSLDSGIQIQFLIQKHSNPWGDPDRLRQVLVNLLLNAQHAMEELPMEEQNVLIQVVGNIEIYIYDNGTGVSQSTLERLFTPFFTTKVQGTGLGLSISLKLLKGMGGDIQFIPFENRGALKGVGYSGACFMIRLPCQPIDQTSEVYIEG
jgi:signal transduction histidine kinase